jgi:hypothetical protein
VKLALEWWQQTNKQNCKYVRVVSAKEIQVRQERGWDRFLMSGWRGPPMKMYVEQESCANADNCRRAIQV